MDQPIEPACRVFISYAHESEEHRQTVLEYSDWLNDPGGLACWIDQYVEDAHLPEGWPQWMRKQVHESKYVLVVCSPKYLKRYDQEEESGKGLGARFESTLMLDEFYQNGSLNAKFIPVVLNSDDLKFIPDILKNQSYYNLSDQGRKDALYRKLTNQPLRQKPQTSKGIIKMNSEKEKVDMLPLTEVKSESFPELKQFKDMKPGTKIVQAFFSLSPVKRFKIAGDLGLVEEGEVLEGQTSDKLSSKFLERAYNKNMLSDLWSKLFDEQLDPNPFKK